MKKLLLSTLAILGSAHYSLGQSIPSYVPKDSLFAWWPFTGNAIDSGGKGNDGAVSGTILTNDRFGNINSAYNFTGTSFINFKNAPTIGSQDFSITGWTKTNSATRNGIICWGRDVSNESVYLFINSAGNLQFDLAYSTGPASPVNIADNSWHFIGVTNNSGLIQLYLDGSPTGSAISMTPNISGSNRSIGQNITNFGPNNFIGSIDDIGIWNRALSACEISKLYLASNTFFTSKPANQAVKIGASASFTIKDTLGASATYQWQENAGTGFVNLSNTSPYSGVNTKTLDINPVAAGMHNNQYRCIRNSGTSCLDTSAAAILTLSNLSIKANQVEGLSIRPNPVHNSLNIHAPATISKMVLYNTLGQLMFESKPGTKTASIDMSVYPAGMYILKLNDEWVEKIIKE